MQLPLLAFLMTRDLSWLTCCSVSSSLFDRLSFGDLTCGGSSVTAVMNSSSLGLLALGGFQVDLGLKGCLGVGGRRSFLKK